MLGLSDQMPPLSSVPVCLLKGRKSVMLRAESCHSDRHNIISDKCYSSTLGNQCTAQQYLGWEEEEEQQLLELGVRDLSEAENRNGIE